MAVRLMVDIHLVPRAQPILALLGLQMLSSWHATYILYPSLHFHFPPAVTIH